MVREGAFRRQRRLNREHPICTERTVAHDECGWKGDDSLARRGRGGNRSGKENTDVFLRPGKPCYGWLRRPSRLKMNSLRSALTAVSPATNRLISGRRETSDMNLPHPEQLLTSTGLLMEGQCTH